MEFPTFTIMDFIIGHATVKEFISSVHEWNSNLFSNEVLQ